MALNRLPVLFLGHGSPMEAIDNDAYTAAVEEFGRALPPLRAIVVASAHWTRPGPLGVTGAARPETIHDFGGFPDALHEMRYAAPGDPALARDIAGRLAAAGLAAEVDPKRGLDHGAWVPLSRLRPAADVPVIELSVPVPSDPGRLIRAGRALAPLRSEGVLLMGSGNVAHNLRKAVFASKEAVPHGWAEEFDAWVWERLLDGRLDELAAYRRNAPNAAMAVPDPDHFDPVFFIAGASDGDRPAPVYEGFHFGNLSMRSWSAG